MHKSVNLMVATLVPLELMSIIFACTQLCDNKKFGFDPNAFSTLEALRVFP
jgi:hypothetical protein